MENKYIGTVQVVTGRQQLFRNSVCPPQILYKVSSADLSAETGEWDQRLSQSYAVPLKQSAVAQQLCVGLMKYF